MEKMSSENCCVDVSFGGRDDGGGGGGSEMEENIEPPREVQQYCTDG